MRIVAMETNPDRRQDMEQNECDAQSPVQNRRKGTWGDEIVTKASDMCRIMVQNPGGIGVNPGPKFEIWKDYIKEKKIDIVGIAEVNVNWRKVTDADRLGDRTSGLFEAQRAISAFNRKIKSTRSDQAGGTGMLTNDRMSYSVQTTGQDPRGMGRWCWMRFKGKGGIQTRVVTAYCPTVSSGEYTNYTQQVETLGTFGIVTCPVRQFWEDLRVELKEWRSKGEQILLMGDFNRDTQNAEEELKELQLKDVLRTRHGYGATPATYQRGRLPIDGILATPVLAQSMSVGGYLPFGELLGDHRGLWVDIPVTAILGYKMGNVATYPARRLKLEDPRIVRKYKEALLHHCHLMDLFRRLDSLRRRATYPLSAPLQREYELLDRIRIQGMEEAERKCRRLCKGNVPWSPELKAAKDTIHLWSLVFKRLAGCKVHARKIVRLRDRLGIKCTLVTLPEAQAQLDNAFKVYKAIKANALNVRLAYQESLAQAKAAEGDTKVESQLRALKHREEQRHQS